MPLLLAVMTCIIKKKTKKTKQKKQKTKQKTKQKKKDQIYLVCALFYCEYHDKEALRVPESLIPLWTGARRILVIYKKLLVGPHRTESCKRTNVTKARVHTVYKLTIGLKRMLNLVSKRGAINVSGADVRRHIQHHPLIFYLIF